MQRKLQQDTQWATKTEVVTASESDTDEEIRMETGHVRRSMKEIVEGGHTVTKVVGTELIEQDPLVEEYMSEEVEHQVRRIPKRRATKQIVREVEESSEEEVIVRKRSPRRRTKVVETVKKSPRRRVEYIQESSSEEEVVQMRRPVVKQRIIAQPAKVQKIVVEEPQQKVIKAVKETIQIPVQTTRTERYEQEEMLETEADRTLMRELETKLRVRTMDLTSKEAEIQQLAAMLEAKKRDFEMCQHDISECSHHLETQMAKPKSHIVSKTREVAHTEYKNKKVRKVTTETPVAVENWKELATNSIQRKSPARSSMYATQVSRPSTQYVYDEEPVVETRVIRKSISPTSRKSRVQEKLYGSSQILPGATYTTSTRDSKVFGSPVRVSTASRKSEKWSKY
jgi:hypothetical protein